MARAKRAGKAGGRRKAPGKGAAPARRPPPPAEPDPWGQLILIVLGVVLGLRLIVNALEPFPVHPVEAGAWALGQAPALGYISRPPLAAWVLGGLTQLLGDTLFVLRLAAPVAHAVVAWLVFLTGRRLWDGRTGFWAAVGYTAAPGAALSAMIVTAEPFVLLAWAAALYAMVRAGQEEGHAWWLALGAAVGAGMLAEYTMLAFALGALGYGLFSARERDWRGTGLAVVAAIAVFAPNLVWNIQNGFATLDHVAGEAEPGAAAVDLWGFSVFLAAQVGIVGPVFLAGILIALGNRAFWRDDRGMRLMAWLTVPLVVALGTLALAGGAPAEWAAPAYVGGCLMAARWLLLAGGTRALRTQVALGVAASLALWTLAGLYAGQADALTRRLDPFRETRLSQPFCELALGAMAEEGTAALLSDDRRRLSECMFLGGLGWAEVAIWNPDGRADSHHERVASLRPDDSRAMLLAVTGDAGPLVRRFGTAREVETGRLATHLDRWVPFSLWVVRDFKGYRPDG